MLSAMGVDLAGRARLARNEKAETNALVDAETDGLGYASSFLARVCDTRI